MPRLVTPVVDRTQLTGEDFGAGLGRGLETIGDAGIAYEARVADAKLRTRNRADAVNRARDKDTFATVLADEQTRIQDEEDPTDPNQAERFSTFVTAKSKELIANHIDNGGSDESVARLTQSIIEQTGSATRSVAKASITAQRDMLDTNLTNGANAIATQVGEHGEIDLGNEQLRLAIEDAAPGLTPSKEKAHWDTGRANNVKTAFSTAQRSGEVEIMRSIIAREDIKTYMDPLDIGKMKGEVLKIDRAATKGIRDGEQKVLEVATIAGIAPEALTKEQRLKIAGLTPREGRVTLQMKLEDFETVVGRPATELEMSKIAGTYIKAEDRGNALGGSFRGLALDRFSRDTEAFANNLLSPIEDNLYIAAATSYTDRVETKNPDTGRSEFRSAQLPAFVSEALKRRSVVLPSQVNSDAPIQGSLDAETAPDIKPENTIFGMAGKVTGPVSGTLSALGRTPVIGEFVRPVETEKARTLVVSLKRNLVRVLQSSPRFNDGERKAIDAEIDLSPSNFDTEGAYQSRVIAIDEAMAIREKAATATLSAGVSTLAERRQAIREQNAIGMFRLQLGAPPLMKSADEARKLPPGTVFRTPTGQILTNEEVEPNG